jgi:undecaprenyl diphosphate synthase
MHIGFIMDGNRRWAKKLGNIPSYGHEKGGESMNRVLRMCVSAGIAHVSLWALSKENVSERSEEELSAIYGLLRRKMPELVELCKKESIRFQTVGDIWLLPVDVRTLLLDAIETTQAGTIMTFILAL